jgi:O-antigen/teichoic acid export membrane protein
VRPRNSGPAPIEHRAFKVSFVNGLTTLLAMGFQFVSVPVCLSYWGRETYGRWLALFSAFMLLRSVDGGYTLYVGNKLNYLYHRNTGALREHLASAAVGVALTGTAQLALAASCLLFGPVAVAVGLSADETQGLTGNLGLLVLTVSWVLTGSYLGVVHRLLIPTGLMYQSAWWNMAFQVCQFGAMITAALLRFNLLQTSALFALAQVVIYVASALYVRRKLPEFTPWWQGARSRTGLTDLVRSLALSASNILQQGLTNGAVLVVAGLAGPAAVPLFTTVRTLSNLWTAATTVLTTPLLPDVVRIHATGQSQKLVVLNEAYWTLIGSVVNLGTLLTFPLLPALYSRWTGHSVPLNQPLVCLMLASVIVANAGGLMALHLNGLNRLSIVLSASAIRTLLGLGGGALLFRSFGLTGIGVGALSGELVALLVTAHYYTRRELTGSGVHMPGAAWAPAILSTASVVIFFVGNALGWWSSESSWVPALAGVTVAAVWGWQRLDLELRSRLTQLPTRLLRGA